MSTADIRDDALSRLEDEIETGRPDEVAQFLVGHLAQWGPDHFDVQRLAERVLQRQGE